jgi:hypothetical protein
MRGDFELLTTCVHSKAGNKIFKPKMAEDQMPENVPVRIIETNE